MKTGIYIRVSTEDQAKDGFSISAQKEKLIKYAEINDWDVYDLYIDDGISGKNLTDRPEINRLLKDVETGNINNVLIYKLDRLTRSVKDLIYLIEFFENHNCTFNSQTEKIDTSNAVGRMFTKIIGIFAEFERENLGERVSMGYEQKTREGHYTNTHGVYGYDYIKGEQKLVVNEFEKALVNRIYDMYLEGIAILRIVKIFNKEKPPTKRGGKWAVGTIRSILTNPLYIGKVRYGTTGKNPRAFTTDGKDIIPIVDEEKWYAVQDLMKNKKKYNIRRYPSEHAYFYPVMKCNKCGAKLNSRQQIQCGKKYITYTCFNKTNGTCDAKGFSHYKAEKAFLEYLQNIEDFICDQDIFNKVQPKLNDNEAIIQDLEKKLKRYEIKRKDLRSSFVNDIIEIEEYKEITETINEEINSLKSKLDDYKRKIEFEKEKKLTYEEIKNIIGNMKLNWKYLTDKEKQVFLERFVEDIEVDKEGEDVIIKSIKFKE